MRRPPPENVYTSVQIMRATELIWNTIMFKKIVDEGRLHVEEDGLPEPELLECYKELFCDKYAYDPTSNNRSRDILIVANNQLLLMEVIKPDGSFASLKAIKNGLYKACGQTINAKESLPLIPHLTTASPIICRGAMNELKSVSKNNNDILKLIERSMFAVCLDSYSSHMREDISIHQVISNFDGSNRWFDKPFQLIINNTGRTGAVCNLNHINIKAVSRIINYLISNEPINEELFDSDRLEVEPPKMLKFDTNDNVDKHLSDAKNNLRSYLSNVIGCAGKIDEFGRRHIIGIRMYTLMHDFLFT